MIFKCYDTCSLLKSADNLFNNSDEFKLLITSITLEELEQIKTSSNKDSETKAAARKVLSSLEQHSEEFKILLYRDTIGELMIKDSFNLTNDAKIVACARHFSNVYPNHQVIFVTNDLLCKQIASCYFEVEKIVEEEYEYDGFKEIFLDEEETANFYSNLNQNTYDLFINEYLLIYDKNSGECIDKLRWTEEGYKHLSYETFSSRHFGDIKPMKNDVYQALLADSLSNNKITMVQGFAGSGKTTLSLGYLMYLLDRHRIDKIIIFCNTVATKNSAKLGLN